MITILSFSDLQAVSIGCHFALPGERSLCREGLSREISMGMMGRLDGLLLSTDAQLLSTMKHVLDRFAIATEVCTDLPSALAAVNGRRLDVLILDWSEARNASETSSAVRRSRLNHKATVLALVNENSEVEAACRAGATFLIHKPASVLQLTRCFRAAYSAILLRRRSAARFPVQIAGDAAVTGVGKINVDITDLSIGGLAVQCDNTLQIGAQVSIGFRLPVTMELIHIVGKVVNTDGKHSSGVCFTFVPQYEHSLLQRWLAMQFATWTSPEPLERAGPPVEGVNESAVTAPARATPTRQ